MLSLIVAAAQCAAIAGAAFADSYTQDGKPCPPECVSDSMEIVTWYPSPYNEYEELRLYPISDSNSQCNSDTRGLMYYDRDEDKVKLCKGPAGLNNWQDLGGSEFWKASTAVSNNIYTDNSVKFGNYSTADRPACNADTLGSVIFDTSKTNLYLCKSGGAWEPVGGYTREQFTTPGTYDFMVPNGIAEIMVEVWSGGGGGGGGGCSCASGSGGSSGENSYVGALISAGGGGGGSGGISWSTCYPGGSGGVSSAPTNVSGNSGSSGLACVSGTGGGDWRTGGAGGTGGFGGGFGAGNGGAGGISLDRCGASGGGGGAYGKGVFDVTGGTLYTVVVGKGGSGGSRGTCSSTTSCENGSAGGDGKVIIYY